MVYVSSSCVKANSVLESIETLSQITKNIELSGGSKESPVDLRSALEGYKKVGFNFLLHGYFPPPPKHFLLNFADTDGKTRDFIGISASFCDFLGIKYYSTHAGFSSDFTIGETENLKDGKKYLKATGIKENCNWFFESFPGLGLALENLFPNHGDKGCCFWMKPECIRKGLEEDERISLLLDLGHLKISANAFGFEWQKEGDFLLCEYPDRIKELHISENGGVYDEHLPITKDSMQIAFLSRHKKTIKDFGINVTIEARAGTLSELRESYDLILKTLEG